MIIKFIKIILNLISIFLFIVTNKNLSNIKFARLKGEQVEMSWIVWDVFYKVGTNSLLNDLKVMSDMVESDFRGKDNISDSEAKKNALRITRDLIRKLDDLNMLFNCKFLSDIISIDQKLFISISESIMCSMQEDKSVNFWAEFYDENNNPKIDEFLKLLDKIIIYQFICIDSHMGLIRKRASNILCFIDHYSGRRFIADRIRCVYK